MGAENISFLAETFSLISCTTIIGVLYGIAFSLYCLCACQLYRKLQKPGERHQARLSLGFLSILLVCATGILALNARVIQLAYVIHDSDFPGGPLEYEAWYNSTPNSIAGSVLDLIIEVSIMMTQIQRLWIIWSGTKYAVTITILPLAFLLSYIALDILANIVASSVSFDQLGISSESVITVIQTAPSVMHSSLTIRVTWLITIRILLVRRQHMKIIPGMSEAARPYLNIVAMLVESYALGAAWSLGTLISLALKSPSQIMFISNDSTVKIIACFLVVYRVETGRGWTKQTGRELTSLQWNRRAEDAPDKGSSIQSQVPTTASAMAVDSPSVIHSDLAA